LDTFGEVERAGTSERKMENSFLRNDAVFPPALGIEKRRKTSTSPRFTKSVMQIGSTPHRMKMVR
jgi:hypothetical protein